MTNCTKYDKIKTIKITKEQKGGEHMVWQEMSYRTYTQTSYDIEPEVWDDIYEPSLDIWISWILETGEDTNATE